MRSLHARLSSPRHFFFFPFPFPNVCVPPQPVVPRVPSGGRIRSVHCDLLVTIAVSPPFLFFFFFAEIKDLLPETDGTLAERMPCNLADVRRTI